MVSDTFSIVRDTFLLIETRFLLSETRSSGFRCSSLQVVILFLMMMFTILVMPIGMLEGCSVMAKQPVFFLSVTCFSSIPHFSGPRRFFLCDYLYFCPLNSILKQEKWS